MSSKKKKNKNNKSSKNENIKKEEIIEERINDEVKEEKEKKEIKENSDKEEVEKIEEKIDKIIEEAENKNSIKENDDKNKDEDKDKKVEEKDNKESKKKETKEKKKEKEATENKKESKSELVKKTSTDLLKKEAEYKRNKISYKVIIIVLVIAFVVFVSTIFGFIHYNSDKIIGGIKIKDINVSNLTREEAKDKIEGAIQVELSNEMILHYNDNYEVKFSPKQIDLKYNFDEVIDKVVNIGKSNNLIVDNYEILINSIIGRNYDLDMSYNEESLNSIIDDIASKIPGKVIDYNYSIEEDELIIQNGTKGVEVNKDKLKEDILNEIKNQKYEDIFEGKKTIIQIEANEREPLAIDIEKIYSEVKCDPVDAHYDLEPYKLYPEQEGIDFKISMEEAKKIVSVPNQNEYKIPLKLIPAAKTIKDIGFEAFPYLISSYSTKYDASNINRSNNLKLAAEKINGTVLMPGETFSYNKVVGKRTVEAGYRDAKIYSNGQVVDGLGGGICQISSTLYNAVLLANLQIVERRNHYFKTSYIAAGRDATVVWGSIDFKFKNTRTYPIKIGASVSNGVAEFKIHGIQEEEEYEISILPVVTATIPYGTQTVVDPTLAPGQQVVSQSGMSGCKVTTYLEKKLNGKVISKEAITSDSYNAMNRVVRVGP